jgi:nucleotide-binding universal stress UspA family protein
LLHFAAERECGLILLGHRAERSGRRSFARRLAMKAPCSVWMAPQGSPPEVRRMLVPVDLSPRSADALEQATAAAVALGLERVDALHVYFNESTSPKDEAYDEALLEEESDRFWSFAARVDLHNIDVEPHFVQSPNVAHTICRFAGEQKVDLIVMGTRGRSRSAAALLGSETEETIIETRIPVLAVKHFGASLSLLKALLDDRFRERSGPRFT